MTLFIKRIKSAGSDFYEMNEYPTPVSAGLRNCYIFCRKFFGISSADKVIYIDNNGEINSVVISDKQKFVADLRGHLKGGKYKYLSINEIIQLFAANGGHIGTSFNDADYQESIKTCNKYNNLDKGKLGTLVAGSVLVTAAGIVRAVLTDAIVNMWLNLTIALLPLLFALIYVAINNEQKIAKEYLLYQQKEGNIKIDEMELAQGQSTKVVNPLMEALAAFSGGARAGASTFLLREHTLQGLEADEEFAFNRAKPAGHREDSTAVRLAHGEIGLKREEKADTPISLNSSVFTAKTSFSGSMPSRTGAAGITSALGSGPSTTAQTNLSLKTETEFRDSSVSPPI